MSLALFFAEHVSNASTFIFRSLRLCGGILRNAHALYYIVICGLPDSTIFSPHYFTNCAIFGTQLLNVMSALMFIGPCIIVIVE